MLSLAVAPVYAADLTFTFNSNMGSGSPTTLPPDADPPCLKPNCALFSGTLTDNDTDLSFLFLRNVSITFSASNPSTGFLSIDNTFGFEVPGVLSGDPAWATDNSGNPANSYAGPIFGIDIAPGTPAGVYTGTATIDAAGGTNDPGNNGFTVTQNFTLTVIPAAQTLTFGALSNQVFGTAPFTLTATDSSGLPVSFASTTPAVCAIAGTTVTIVATGVCSITASQGGNAEYAAATPVTQTFTVNPGLSASVVDAGGIVNNAGYTSPVSPGSLIAIFGSNLATATSLSFSFPLPTTWSGTSVTINGVAAPLLYVTPVQIGVQVPPNALLGTATVIVTVYATTATGAVTILSAAPGLFADSSGRAAAQHGDGSAVTPGNPADSGEEIVLYGSGQGPLTITPPLGSAAGSGSLCVDSVTVTIGGANSTVDFCGLASGFVGLTQINVTVPAGLSAGDAPVVVTINGVASAPAVVAVSGH